MSKAQARTPMVLGGEPPRCPQCRSRLAFGTDRSGRAVEQCDCGYRNYVAVRTGSAAVAAAATPPAEMTQKELT